MALGVTGDASVLAILKEYYGVQQIESLVFRNSPVLGRIKKERVGGKYVPLPMAVYGSGAVTADYTQVISQAANSYLGVSMEVTPGRLFSSFVIDPQEWLASQMDKAAFKSVFAIRAFLALDDMRKVLASAFYRTGYLELGTVLTGGVDTTNYLYVDVDPSTAMAVSPGTQILFAASTPNGTLRSANAVVVDTIVNIQSSGNVRITFTSSFPATVVATDWLLIKGGRDAGGNPNSLVGLGGWVPSTANRSGATWNTYIGTSFFGVDRSVAPERLAGQFVQRNSAASESYTDALIRLIKQVRRGGGVPDMIVCNDEDFQVILNDALKNRTFFQSFDSVSSARGNKVTQGLSMLNMSFSTNWISMVYDDPYCPKGVAYVLDAESLRLFTITNAQEVLKELPLGNEPGAPNVQQASELNSQYVFLQDDMYTTSPVALQSGPGLRVDLQLFGQFAVLRPAHNGVCVF
jgi:hypothetical protein